MICFFKEFSLITNLCRRVHKPIKDSYKPIKDSYDDDNDDDDYKYFFWKQKRF